MENANYVICPLCNKNFKELTQHLFKTHNMKIEDFKKLYPNNLLFCAALSETRKKGNINARNKIKNSIKIKNLEIENKYYETPKHCKCCNKIIEYNKKENNFCNQSCAAKFNSECRNDLSLESKTKISYSLKKYYSVNKKIKIRIQRECKICKKIMNIVPSDDRQTCSKECGNKLQSIKMVESCKTRVVKNNWKCCRCDSKYYGNIHVDSTWEKLMIENLEKHNIFWTKPKYFKWIDRENKERLYFPDFYLPSYDIYLDPKNPYLAKLDDFKINQIIQKYNIKLFVITNEKDLTWDYVRSLIDGAVNRA